MCVVPQMAAGSTSHVQPTDIGASPESLPCCQCWPDDASGSSPAARTALTTAGYRRPMSASNKPRSRPTLCFAAFNL